MIIKRKKTVSGSQSYYPIYYQKRAWQKMKKIKDRPYVASMGNDYLREYMQRVSEAINELMALENELSNIWVDRIGIKKKK